MMQRARESDFSCKFVASLFNKYLFFTRNNMKPFTILLILLCFISCSLRPKKNIDDRINEAIELQKNKQLEEAMEIYYQVLPEAEDLGKRSVICYNLGAMYLWDRIFDKAYDMFHQAYICDSLLKDTASMSRLLNRMGAALNNMQDSAGGEQLQRKALQLAHAINDSAILYDLYSQFEYVYQHLGQWDSVAHYIRLASRYIPADQSPSKQYAILGEVYRMKGDADSARYYYEKGMACPDMNSRLPAYFYSAQLELYLKNYQKAYEHLLAYTMSADTLYAQQKTTELEKLAYQHEAEMKVHMVKEKHRLYIGISILVLVTAVFIFLLIVQNLRKRKRIIRLEYENERKNLREKIALLKQNLHSENDEKEHLQQRMEEQIGQLRSISFRRTPIYRRLETLSAQNNKEKKHIKVMNEKEQSELKQVIFEIYRDYISQLQSQYPKLTEADLLYSCLASAGLSTFAIALCFGNSDTGIVAQRKRRLKLKMEAGEPDEASKE